MPNTPELEQAWLDRSKSYATACARKNDPALLDDLTTLDSVRDMDGIRQALGQQQINYYGFSYGTYLGQVYGTLFPDRVRRMVLDSNVDPRRVWYPAQLDQDRAFDRNIGIYFEWIAKYHDVFHLGATEQAVEKLYYSVLADLDAHPAGGLIGPDEWTDLFLGAALLHLRLGGRSPTRSPAGCTTATGSRSRRSTTRRSASATTTASLCTSACSAPTPTGRRAAPHGGPTAGASTRRRRS